MVNRWAYGPRPSGWAYPSAMGIAFLIAVGGVLNAVHLAKPPVLLTLLAVGLALAVFFVCRSFLFLRKGRLVIDQLSALPAWNTFGNLLYLTFILVVFVFLVQALLPSRSFNFHDDFHIYLMWPVRMLQTGSLGGNPFDHIGVSSLGAQAFMQGMFLTFSPLSDINGFDAIVCLILTLGLLKELGERLGVHIVFIFTACALALFINPQYVNVTSIYSGALMLLGLTFSTLLLTESVASSDSSGIIRAAVPCSLFFAALLALKTTFVFMAPVFWAASLAGSLLLIRVWRPVLLAHASSAVVSISLLIPWLTVHLDRYIQKIHYIIDGIGYPNGRNFSASLLTKGDVLSQLFSNKELFWGNSYRDYLYIDFMLLFALAMASWAVWRKRGRRETFMVIPLLVLLFSMLCNYLLFYKMTFFLADRIIRYSCPLVIGVAPIAALLAGWLWTKGHEPGQENAAGRRTFLVISGLLLIFQITIVGGFRETFVERLKRAWNYGTLISFPLAYNPRYIEYNAYALSDEAAQKISWIQNLVPAGEAIFAWVSLPIYLDYSRNTTFATSEYGLSNNLLVMPLAEGTSGMRRYFQQRGIRYFIWEYQGYGVKPEAQLAGLQRSFIEVLTELLPTSKILYNDGGIIAFDIGPEIKQLDNTVNKQ